MTIILDFDHTLFDMQLLHEELIAGLEKIGITEKVYREAYSLETRWKVFTVQGFAGRLSAKSTCSQAEIEKALWDVARASGHCLYSDVMDTCRRLKEAGHTLSLLSWGDEAWQGEKIKQAGISTLFDEVVTITDLKADYLKERQSSEQLVLVDDKPAELKSVQDARPDIRLVRMRRDGAKYSDTPTPDGIEEVKDMQELFDRIQTST